MHGLTLIGGPFCGRQQMVTDAVYDSGVIYYPVCPPLRIIMERPDPFAEEVIQPRNACYRHPGRNSRNPHEWVYGGEA